MPYLYLFLVLGAWIMALVGLRIVLSGLNGIMTDGEDR